MLCDARRRDSAEEVLILVAEHAPAVAAGTLAAVHHTGISRSMFGP